MHHQRQFHHSHKSYYCWDWNIHCRDHNNQLVSLASVHSLASLNLHGRMGWFGVENEFIGVGETDTASKTTYLLSRFHQHSFHSRRVGFRPYNSPSLSLGVWDHRQKRIEAKFSSELNPLLIKVHQEWYCSQIQQHRVSIQHSQHRHWGISFDLCHGTWLMVAMVAIMVRDCDGCGHLQILTFHSENRHETRHQIEMYMSLCLQIYKI